MISKVKLKNWKSHLDSEFTFSTGVNALMGINGSGKTSVMESICFALFGTFPALQSRKLAIDDIIMKKPIKKNTGMVEIELNVNGDNYTLKRVIENGKGTIEAEIRKNGKLLDVNAQGVTREAERILQMDYDMFSKAVYSEQNGLDYFLRIPKGQRMQHIDRMLKLDRFEKAREKTIFIVNKLKHGREEKIRIVNEMEKDDLKNKIVKIENDIEKLNKEKILLLSEKETVKKKEEELSKNIYKTEAKEKELITIEKTVEGLKKAVQEITKNLTKKMESIKNIDLDALLKQNKEINDVITELENKLNKNRDEYTREARKSATVEERFKTLEQEIIKISDEVEQKQEQYKNFIGLKKKLGENPEKTIKEKTLDLEVQKKLIYSLTSKKEELIKHINDLKRVKICPLCSSNITEIKREGIIKGKSNKIAKLEDKISSEDNKIKRKEKKLNTMRDELQDFVILKENIKDMKEKVELLEKHKKVLDKIKSSWELSTNKQRDMNKNIKSIENKLKITEEKKDKLSNLLLDFEFIKDLEKRKKDYDEKLEELLTKKTVLDKELSQIDLNTLRKYMQEFNSRQREISTRLTGLSEILKDKSIALNDMKKRENIMLKYIEEIKLDTDIIKKLSDFTQVLKITQDQLRTEFLKTVNYIMNKIWPSLYPYKDFNEIRLIIDDDYILQLNGSDGWTSVEGIVSGGERNTACLTLRIAFSLAFIPNLKWLILDEPTHNMDINAIKNFSNLLRDKMDLFTDQVFLVTHEEGISSNISGSLYKLERDKEKNEPTRTIQL